MCRRTNMLRVCAYVRVCVCLSPFTLFYVNFICLDQLDCRKQINDVVLKTLFSYAKYLIHRYFRMKQQTFLTSHFMLFTHCASRFESIRPSSTIIGHRFRSALHHNPICHWCLHSREGSESDYERLK